MYCEHGHDNVVGAAYCSSCGLRLALALPVELRPTERRDTLRGQLLGERFRLLERIGEGGMGMVYAAEQTLGTTTRKVAIKMLWPAAGRGATAKERCLLEAAVIAQLAHPNTVRVYDFGTTPEGMPFLVMEFLSGEPLSLVLRREEGGSCPRCPAPSARARVPDERQPASDRHGVPSRLRSLTSWSTGHRRCTA